MKKNKKNINFIMGISIIAFMALFILMGKLLPLRDANAIDASLKFAHPSLKHPFGCDNFGREILSRVMAGSLSTFLIAMGTVIIGSFFGIVIGALTGYFGGVVDEVLMRINDAIFAFPSILLALLFISLLGPGTYQVVIALGIAFIPSFARIVRAEFLKNRNRW